MEALSRGFAIELGANGIRCVCIRAEGMPETPLLKEVIELHRSAGDKTDTKDFLDILADSSMLKKLPTLQEFANMAAFMASDGASCTTAAVINVSGGRIAD
jgi:NAD(P)-dependent dehydrogenase (short-subunit alcohol dehydrogenase family)